MPNRVDSGQKWIYNRIVHSQMAVFMKFMTGTVEHQLDGKNRIRIPAKFRSAFPEKETLYFVRYNADRVAVMPESVLNAKMKVFDDITPDDEEAMDAMAKILGSVEELSEDNQGRTMIPRYFRDAAGIEKDVVTVGMGTYIEIWAKQLHEEKMRKMTVQHANAVAYGRKNGNER